MMTFLSFFVFIIGCSIVLLHENLRPLWGICAALLLLLCDHHIPTMISSVIVILLSICKNPFSSLDNDRLGFVKNREMIIYFLVALFGLFVSFPFMVTYPFYLICILIIFSAGAVLAYRERTMQWSSLIVCLGAMLIWTVEAQKIYVMINIDVLMLALFLLSKVIIKRDSSQGEHQ